MINISQLWYISHMFVDSHCHLEMELFEKDRKKVIDTCIKEGLVYILTVGTEEKYFEKVIQLIDENPSVYGAIGIHPHNSRDLNDALIPKINKTLTHNKIVAYGEIGLDFFKNYSPKDIQVDAFKKQLKLAGQAKLPIIVHSRNAKDETLQILRETKGNDAGGVMHCYSYDLDAARKLLDMGFYISIPGTITYTSAQKLVEVVQYLPMDRMLAETDAPFLTPHPHRGKRNEPYYVKYTIEKIAQIKNKRVEEIAAHIHDNFKRLFLTGRVVADRKQSAAGSR
ncbi:MAG: TatD family hydrolase [Proteobacteria bacterium]|nr:TatD family hydrolase [Pseudomonadota bacterium]